MKYVNPYLEEFKSANKQLNEIILAYLHKVAEIERDVKLFLKEFSLGDSIACEDNEGHVIVGKVAGFVHADGKFVGVRIYSEYGRYDLTTNIADCIKSIWLPLNEESGK